MAIRDSHKSKGDQNRHANAKWNMKAAHMRVHCTRQGSSGPSPIGDGGFGQGAAILERTLPDDKRALINHPNAVAAGSSFNSTGDELVVPVHCKQPVGFLAPRPPRRVSSRGAITIIVNQPVHILFAPWVATWGNGDFGRLGHEGRWSEVYPRKVAALDDIDVKEVCAGGAHTAVVSGRVRHVSLYYGLLLDSPQFKPVGNKASHC
eukprot:2880350-Pyramimonas_sp.AAC.1